MVGFVQVLLITKCHRKKLYGRMASPKSCLHDDIVCMHVWGRDKGRERK